MFVSKVYIPLSDLSKMFFEKLSEQDREKFVGYDFVPISLKLNELNMSLEALFVPTPDIEGNTGMGSEISNSKNIK